MHAVRGSLFIVLVVFVVITLSRGIRSIPQGEEWTVERFGRYTHTLSPGLRFIVPFVDQIGAKVNMMETVLDIGSQDRPIEVAQTAHRQVGGLGSPTGEHDVSGG